MSTYHAIDNSDQLRERVKHNGAFRESLTLSAGSKIEKGVITDVYDLHKLTTQQLEEKAEQTQQATDDILNEDLDTMVRCYACSRHYDCAEYDQCPHCGVE